MSNGLNDFDAVVVGSGAGGGFCAMQLAQQGVKVLLLEQGKRFDPDSDFPMHHRNWELQPNPFVNSGLETTIEHQPGEKLPAGSESLCSSGGASLGGSCTRRNPYRYQRVHGLGGSTLHYQGEAHRFNTGAFKPFSRYGHGVDWPIQYEDLEPYYEKAEHILGVAGTDNNPYKIRKNPFPTPAHPLSVASQLAKKGADHLGWALLQNSLALPSKSVDGRLPCQHSGGCVQGCLFGAKSSVDLTAIALGERTGNLSVQTGYRVIRIDHDGVRATSLLCIANGMEISIRTRAVVMAGGAIESPRLLLNSDGPGHPTGMGNSHDQVGRYFLDMMLVTMTVQFNQRVNGYKGPPIDCRIWDFNDPTRHEHCQSGIVLGVSGTMSGFHGPMSYVRAASGIGLVHKQAVRERFGSYASLFAVSEHDPQSDNRISLGEQKDQDGTPMVRIQTQFSKKDQTAFKAMFDLCHQWADACDDLKKIEFTSTFSDPSGSQVGGGCRMGNNPEQSVVDAWGQLHTHKNVFVADASVLPGQGGGDSPSLTIQALAMRTADRVVSLMSNKEL